MFQFRNIFPTVAIMEVSKNFKCEDYPRRCQRLAVCQVLHTSLEREESIQIVREVHKETFPARSVGRLNHHDNSTRAARFKQIQVVPKCCCLLF